jgi:hypothetical protein
MQRRYGDHIIPATRAAVMDVLTAALPQQALRNLAMSLAGRVVPDVALLRAIDPVVAWRPPR